MSSFTQIVTEALKKGFLKPNERDYNPSTEATPVIQQSLTKPDDNFLQGWYNDGKNDGSAFSLYDQFGRSTNTLEQQLETQAQHIKQYRQVSEIPDVSNGIDEIVNEFLFTASEDSTLEMMYDQTKEISSGIKNGLENAFKDVMRLLNFDETAYTLVKQWFTDGQLNIQVVYNENKLREGIKELNILNPLFLYFDNDRQVWRYKSQGDTHFVKNDEREITFAKEEVIKIDSGIFAQGIIRSNLQQVVKVANQLQQMEDMLIPMRFNRSVARRIFNVDVSGMSAVKAKQSMMEMQNSYKYKKVYDPNTGSIQNQNSVMSIVEDYWMASRDGKGLDVTTLDESGNLGELGDIEYFEKKVYKAMKIPLGRLSLEGGSDFDFGGMTISRDEIKFFSYVSRLRRQFNRLFLELIKRQLIATGKMSEQEFEDYSKFFKLVYTKENTFLEKLDAEAFKERVETYTGLSELIGVDFSRKWAKMNILKMTEKEIDEMKKEIDEEKDEYEPEDSQVQKPQF